jgi:hypothetical protein
MSEAVSRKSVMLGTFPLLFNELSSRQITKNIVQDSHVACKFKLQHKYGISAIVV